MGFAGMDRYIFFIALLVFPVVSISSQNIIADSTDQAAKQEHIELPDVTVTSWLTAEGALRATGAVRMKQIDPLDIQPADGIEDLLGQAPGIVAQVGSAGTKKVTIRGIGSRSAYGTNRIKAYYGQIPLTTADGVTAFDEPDPWLIGSVEIIRGPASAIYGPGLGGAVVFKPEESSELKLRTGLQTGSFGLMKGGLAGRIPLKEHTIITGIGFTGENGYRENSASEHTSGQFIWRYNGKRLQTDLLLTGSDFRAGIPSSLNYEQWQEDPVQAAPNWLAVKGYEENRKLLGGATVRLSLPANWKLWLTISGNAHRGHEHRPFNVLDDKAEMAGLRFRTEHRSGRSSFSLGTDQTGEWYNASYYETVDTLAGDLLATNQQRRYSANYFIWYSFRPGERMILNAGVNMNLLRYRMTGSLTPDGEHQYAPVLSPRIGLNYRILAKHYLYLSAGHGLSHPTTEETLAPPGMLNRELKPEQGKTVEAGIRGSGRIAYDLTAYIIWLRDQLLTKREDEATFYGVNGGQSRLMGIEASVSAVIWQSPDLRSRIRMESSGWISQNVFTDFIDDGADYSGNYLPGIPGFTFNAGLTAELSEHWQVLIRNESQGRQWLDDLNSARTDSWSKTDLLAGFLPAGKRGRKGLIELGIGNILNNSYASMILPNAPSFGGALPRYYYPAPPRHFLLRMEFRL